MKKLVSFISISIFLLLCSCGAKKSISEELVQSASVTAEVSVETSTVSTVASEEPVSKEPEGLEAYEGYLDLIDAIEAAMYDHSLIDENPNLYYEYSGTERSYICSFEFFGHLYDGSDGIAYQNLGFLIKDIDGDGVEELLLGENDTHPEKNYDGALYDLYTYENGHIKHLFSGWPRRLLYLTENNDFVCEWATSADEYGKIFYRYENGNLQEVEKLNSEPSYVFPEFNLIGPIWKPVGDLGGDGRNDYVILNKKDGVYRLFSLYIAGEGTVYEHEDDFPIDVGELATAVDLDRDGEKEIVVTILPNINSASLTEFAVIKKEGDSWKELDNLNNSRVAQGDYYSFPLVMVHDEGFKINLSCEGLDKVITFDVEENYNSMTELAADQWSTEAEKNAKRYYEKEILSSPSGTPVGYISEFGVWDVKLGEYDGFPYLVALQGVEGPLKYDLWGRVEIYFDYDQNGKIRILDLKFSNNEQHTFRPYKELDDGTWECEGYTYKYRLEIIGRMPNAAHDSRFVFLSNIEEIPFDRAWKAAGFSSNLDDYFAPGEAVLVELGTLP